MSKDVVQIEGFDKLKRQITRLSNDKRKRAEILKVQRKAADPVLKAAKSFAPVGTRKHTRDKQAPGHLKASLGKRVGKKGEEKSNAVLYVGPRITGKWNGWYAHFVAGGTNASFTGQRTAREARRRRKTANKGGISPNNFMRKAYNSTQGRITKEYEEKTAKAIQKQIDKLSK